MNVYEVSAPDGEILGLVRARSAGQALRRINELCGVHDAGPTRLLR